MSTTDSCRTDIEHYRETLKDVFQGTYGVLQRMRLACQVFSSSGEVVDRCSGAGSGKSCASVHVQRCSTSTTIGWQVMNEVALHRGRYPHLSVVDAFVNGQHLTEAVVRRLA
jgi:NADH kinase